MAKNDTRASSSQKVPDKEGIRYERWIHADTGEEREFAVVEKHVYKDADFYLTFLPDILRATKEFGKAKNKILEYILSKVDPQTHLFIGKYRDIARETKTSQRTIAETITYLVEIDFLRKKAQSVYTISPRYIARGEAGKGRNLMVRYRAIPYTKQEAEAIKRQLSLI
ncbi:MAG: replication/maintenance protein RepL [Cyclobacteriaceae bacterium]